MCSPIDMLIQQLNEILSEHQVLRDRSRHEDLSDLPTHELQRFLTRAHAAVERAAGQDSTYGRRAAELMAVKSKIYIGEKVHLIAGIIDGIRDDLEKGVLEPPGKVQLAEHDTAQDPAAGDLKKEPITQILSRYPAYQLGAAIFVILGLGFSVGAFVTRLTGPDEANPSNAEEHQTPENDRSSELPRGGVKQDVTALIEQKIRPSRDARFLASFLTHAHTKVAEAAAFTLSELGAEAEPARSALEKAKNDQRGLIAKYASAALENLGS